MLTNQISFDYYILMRICTIHYTNQNIVKSGSWQMLGFLKLFYLLCQYACVYLPQASDDYSCEIKYNFPVPLYGTCY